MSDLCENEAKEQFAWCDQDDGLMRWSVPYCTEHSQACQPAETTEVMELAWESSTPCRWMGEDSFAPAAVGRKSKVAW